MANGCGLPAEQARLANEEIAQTVNAAPRRGEGVIG
jgi:hypothetical protein